MGVVVGKARGEEELGVGEEKLCSGRLGTGSRGASVLEAFENVESVKDVVVKVGRCRNVVVFVTGGVRIVGRGGG